MSSSKLDKIVFEKTMFLIHIVEKIRLQARTTTACLLFSCTKLMKGRNTDGMADVRHDC